MCELLIVLWGQLLTPVCTDIDILDKAELCGVLARPFRAAAGHQYFTVNWRNLFLQT